ncbi:hypothetical protein HDU79_009688 [Rhizoclosmatium sp. JEL0117]|nr:hypothetical protein HDU79_009688 [Rhizoclosmatium sp. JEL0117]
MNLSSTQKKRKRLSLAVPKASNAASSPSPVVRKSVPQFASAVVTDGPEAVDVAALQVETNEVSDPAKPSPNPVEFKQVPPMFPSLSACLGRQTTTAIHPNPDSFPRLPTEQVELWRRLSDCCAVFARRDEAATECGSDGAQLEGAHLDSDIDSDVVPPTQINQNSHVASKMNIADYVPASLSPEPMVVDLEPSKPALALVSIPTHQSISVIDLTLDDNIEDDDFFMPELPPPSKRPVTITLSSSQPSASDSDSFAMPETPSTHAADHKLGLSDRNGAGNSGMESMKPLSRPVQQPAGGNKPWIRASNQTVSINSSKPIPPQPIPPTALPVSPVVTNASPKRSYDAAFSSSSVNAVKASTDSFVPMPSKVDVQSVVPPMNTGQRSVPMGGGSKPWLKRPTPQQPQQPVAQPGKMTVASMVATPTPEPEIRDTVKSTTNASSNIPPVKGGLVGHCGSAGVNQNKPWLRQTTSNLKNVSDTAIVGHVISQVGLVQPLGQVQQPIQQARKPWLSNTSGSNAPPTIGAPVGISSVGPSKKPWMKANMSSVTSQASQSVKTNLKCPVCDIIMPLGSLKGMLCDGCIASFG